jgi:hypothetical protein
MRLPKVESERRTRVALEYFVKNPNATGEALNKALVDGTLTGKREPALNIKKVYDLRKEARAQVAQAERAPNLPPDEFKNARRFQGSAAVAQTGPTLTEEARQHIQGLLGEFRNMSPDVMDITVRRDGTVNIGRLARTEESLSLGSSRAARG